MANIRTSASTSEGRYEEASVDTDPGANGYGINAVSIQHSQGIEAEEMWFYIKSIGTAATITLQWSSDNSTFYDYDDYTAVGKYIIRDKSAGAYWKPIIKDDAQGSAGTSIFGISW